MQVANIDGAMDKHDSIVALAIIRSRQVLTSGLGLLAIFEALFAAFADICLFHNIVGADPYTIIRQRLFKR